MTTTISAPAVSTLLPLELVDKAIGSRIHIIMKNDKEPDFLSTYNNINNMQLCTVYIQLKKGHIVDKTAL